MRGWRTLAQRSALNGGIPGPQGRISGLGGGGSYSSCQGWFPMGLEAGRGPKRGGCGVTGVRVHPNLPRASRRQFRVPVSVGGTDRELVDPSVQETRCLSQGKRRCCD